MRVLMTGHRGYIGAVATPLFLQAGHEVVGLDSDLYRRCTYGGEIGPAGEIEAIDCDIRDATVDMFKGFDAVAHFAGLSNDPLGNLDPELTYDINFRATVRLASLAKEAGVPRFIFSSSCSNYGAAGDNIIDEMAEFNPVTAYGRSKVMAEEGLLKLADADFSPVLMRSATAFGASPRIRFDLVVNNLTAWAYTTGQVMLKSDGTPWRPLVHIEDISRAFLAVAEAPREKVHAEAFNVGSTAQNYQIIELARMVEEELPEARITFTAEAGPDLRNYRVSCDKLAAAFPHAVPRWSARDGVRELHGVFKRYGLDREGYEGERYQRVAHLKSLLASGEMGADLRWTR